MARQLDPKDYIMAKGQKSMKFRPDVFYVENPKARRKYQTAIRAPDQNFFQLMYQRNVYFWIVVKKNFTLDSQFYLKCEKAFKSAKSLQAFKDLPICRNFEECKFWISKFPCQIIMDEDIFSEVFYQLVDFENASGFHIVSPDNCDIARASREYRRIKNIYDDYDYILDLLRQNIERIAIIDEEKKALEKEVTKESEELQRRFVRNVVFPNFIKLSKHDKSEHNQYRLHLIGLRKLTEDDRLASKDKFVEFSKEKFPEDIELIEQYAHAPLDTSKEVLRFYTLDSFFYRCLNNSLRLAKNTEEFFTIGEPFNRVFEAIQNEYVPKDIKVYRGADLTPSESEYLVDNIGRYIEINGFISTSKNPQTAKKFARDRKNNKIFEIHIRKVPQKYKQYDYGFVDLQQQQCSAFDQDQILINALNVFRIKDKISRDGFQIFVLEYGAIFDILESKDPNKLSQNDRYAYYSFKELREMNEEVTDIGQVYLRTYEPQKAIEIYRFKLQKMEEETNIGISGGMSSSEDANEIRMKLAEAYLANGQPDRALQTYQRVMEPKKRNKKRNKETIKKYSSDIISNKDLIRESARSREELEEKNEMFRISTKVSSIQKNTDKYEDAEKEAEEAKRQMRQEMKESFSVELFESNLEIEEERYQSRISQMLFQEAYEILKGMEKQTQEVLEKGRQKSIVIEPYEFKKLQLKKTELYEKMASIVEKLQIEKSQVSSIMHSFKSTRNSLASVIEKESYEDGILNMRQSQVLCRTGKFDITEEQRKMEKSLQMVRKNTEETDEVLPKFYEKIALFKKKFIKSQNNTNEAKLLFKKKQKHQTVIYGNEDPRVLLTKTEVANCERQQKDTYKSLETFSEAYHTDLYKKKNEKYSHHAKVLFHMAQAYSDKGDDGMALKNYQTAYDILKKRLSPNDFNKSVLRYKITLRIGRMYTTSSLKTPDNLKLAEKNLKEYHTFIIKFYDHHHTDIALSYNCLGVLYSAKKKFDESKGNFVESLKIYEDVQGTTSLDVAKTKANISICYAQLRNQSKALRELKDSEQIFEKIYGDLRKINPFEYESKYIEAEILFILKKFKDCIKSCQDSIAREQEFMAAKKKLNSSYLANEMKEQSQFMHSAEKLPEIRSGMPVPFSENLKKVNSKSQIDNNGMGNGGSLSSINPGQNINSQFSIQALKDRTSEHGFKCRFKICECLINLKQYGTAKKRLQRLKNDLELRLAQQNKNFLLKDSKDSKKRIFLKRCDDLLKRLKDYEDYQQFNAEKRQYEQQKEAMLKVPGDKTKEKGSKSGGNNSMRSKSREGSQRAEKSQEGILFKPKQMQRQPENSGDLHHDVDVMLL